MPLIVDFEHITLIAPIINSIKVVPLTHQPVPLTLRYYFVLLTQNTQLAFSYLVLQVHMAS